MTTPARQQYLTIKREHRDSILLFRMGDFFETFDEDAHIVARELEIALTSREMGRGNRVPLAGIPYHSLEPYLAKLIKRGHKVAICEQTSDPQASKGLVEREVVRVVTPGTVTEDTLLDGKSNNYLASLFVKENEVGLSYVDITTSEFATGQLPLGYLEVELARLHASELITAEPKTTLPQITGLHITDCNQDLFDIDHTTSVMLDHFGVATLDSYGCSDLPLAVQAAGAIISYLRDHNKNVLSRITSLHTYTTDSHMFLDTQTRQNLELFEGGRRKDPKTSLFSVLDHTKTAMGGRLLRRWIGQPLINVTPLEKRLDAVSWFHRESLRRGQIASELDQMSDIERIINRVRTYIASPRDLNGLAASIEATPRIRSILTECDDSSLVHSLAVNIRDNTQVSTLVRDSISDDPPQILSSGGVIRHGFSQELDDIRRSEAEGHEYIARLENTERKRTEIKNLKVGYNKVFGYYIEISNSQLDKTPPEYIRKQTLVGGERFITPEMKNYEALVLSAQERITSLESSIFRQVCDQLAESAESVLETAKAIAHIDASCSLAEAASQYDYVRPSLVDSQSTEIVAGRHPVVERTIAAGDFVPNDVRLSTEDHQLVLLTGPNMAGKSTFIRQVALITLMAQIGSFVPANSATIGLADRIFTRVGLQDDLSLGQSTFMVEMIETAAILNQATSSSLVILDEIGRGTSTYDGLAIARSVAEYIHDQPRLGCRTLFATHYHELTGLGELLARAQNYSVAVTENNGEVVFLRQIVPGSTDRSYGVFVAKLAGMPNGVINRARTILNELENGTDTGGSSDNPFDSKPRNSDHRSASQLELLPKTSPLLDDLIAIDITSMTPIEAINKLHTLQKQATETSDGFP